jgi:WD40 repeat-containing protein SMU1
MSSTSPVPIPAADILRLVEAHLIEAGLHQSARCLASETGIGLAGALQHNWTFHCAAGNWSMILEQLSLIDRARARISDDLVASVHEMAILEVAEAGDWNLAASMLRLVASELQESLAPGRDDKMSRGRLIDQKLADLAILRNKDQLAPVPPDWYYAGSKQQMRDDIGKALSKAVPHQPSGRLTALLQQAVQWQAYTGELPQIKQWWIEEDTGEQAPKKKKKRKKEFDLVLGQVSVDPFLVGDSSVRKSTVAEEESHAKEPYAAVKLGKQVTCESACFLPDQSGLVTGSSDGLIEIWDASQDYKQLKLDLPYQQKDELLGHDRAVTALAISNDGTMLASGSDEGKVKVWRVDTGKCLRTIEAHQNAVACMSFSPDGSHILTGGRDGMVREFGLRTARMLKELRGHTAFVNHVSYQLVVGQQLIIFTASGDGTVRLWDTKAMDTIRILRPVSLGGNNMSKERSSIVIDAQQTSADGAGAAAIHSVLHLHTPASTMILVPRGYRAFLVDYTGEVLRTYECASSSGDKVFVAASVSPSNRSLYCVREDGVCCVFNVTSGELTGTIRDFGTSTMRFADKDAAVGEISSVLCHPTKNMIAAYSNSKGQSRGQIVLWK